MRATERNINIARAAAIYYGRKEGEKMARTQFKALDKDEKKSEALKLREQELEQAAEEKAKEMAQKMFKQMCQQQEEEARKASDEAIKKQKEAEEAAKKAEDEKKKTAEEAEKAAKKAEQEKKAAEEAVKKQKEAEEAAKKAEDEKKKADAEAAKKQKEKLQAAAVLEEAPKAANSLGFDVGKFVKKDIPAQSVPISDMNGSTFVQAGQNTTIQPVKKHVLSADETRAWMQMNPNVGCPVDMMPDASIDEKKAELKKYITFTGEHKNVDILQINSLLSLIKGSQLRSQMREMKAKDRANNPQLVETPVVQYDATGRYDFAFEQALQNKDKKMVILFQSVPAWNSKVPNKNGTSGAWVNDTTIFAARK